MVRTMAEQDHLETRARAFLAEMLRRELVTLVNRSSAQSVRESLAFLFGEDEGPRAARIAEHLIEHADVVDLHCDDDTIATIVAETEPGKVCEDADDKEEDDV
jgi:hypothetical protein